MYIKLRLSFGVEICINEAMRRRWWCWQLSGGRPCPERAEARMNGWYEDSSFSESAPEHDM